MSPRGPMNSIRGLRWRSIAWKTRGCAAWWRGTSLAPPFGWDRGRGASPSKPAASRSPVQIVNGRFVANGKVLWGGTVNAGWWRGQAVPAAALDAGVSLTRFVPGRTGPGLTEDLPALAALMAAQGTP